MSILLIKKDIWKMLNPEEKIKLKEMHKIRFENSSGFEEFLEGLQ